MSPISVGKIIPTIIHLILLVSFFIIREVVPQGKCISENIIVHIAVLIVHPFSNNNTFNDEISKLVRDDSDIYVIIIIGITISLAGKPNINENSITPSIPKCLANGSKNIAICCNKDIPCKYVLEKIHIISPVGADTIIAFIRTFSVLSNIEFTIIFFICGFLNGGSSNINGEDFPFIIVLESSLDTSNVVITDNIIRDKSISVDVNVDAVKNIVISVIRVGNLPLHGTKLFVRIAINLSFLELMILDDITPQALHPKPIHIVRDCFPLVHALLNNLSILNASLGK